MGKPKSFSVIHDGFESFLYVPKGKTVYDIVLEDVEKWMREEALIEAAGEQNLSKEYRIRRWQ